MRPVSRAVIPLLWLAALACLACDDGGSPTAAQGGADARPSDGGGADAGGADSAAPDAGPACDATQRPLVMAHGFLAAGDTWAPHLQRFASNGHCPDRYLAFDWNTLDRRADHAAALDAVVDAARARFGVEQVDLMGHSAGGGLGYTYLADPARAAKVAHYVHVGSSPNAGPAGPEGAAVPTLNLWSPADPIVAGADIPGAENAALEDLDHYAVATDPAAFSAVYEFLYGQPPASTEITPEAPVWIAGVAATLGDNAPAAGAALEIWAVDAATGQRTQAEPVARLTVADDGRWGPVEVAAGVHHELHLTPTGGGRQVHYYREPFHRSNPLVYLRALPSGGLAGALLSGVPFANAHTVAVVFSSSQAVITGRDRLALEGELLSTEALAAVADSLIALFIYDVEVDGADGGPIATFQGFPFLNGIDRFIPADEGRSFTVELNGRFLAAPRWPSAAHGAVVFVFD